MNIFKMLADQMCLYIDIVCCCINCFEPREVLYDGDYITNYLINIAKEIETSDRYSIVGSFPHFAYVA